MFQSPRCWIFLRFLFLSSSLLFPILAANIFLIASSFSGFLICSFCQPRNCNKIQFHQQINKMKFNHWRNQGLPYLPLLAADTRNQHILTHFPGGLPRGRASSCHHHEDAQQYAAGQAHLLSEVPGQAPAIYPRVHLL